MVSPDGQIGRYKTLPRFEVIKEGVDKQMEFRSVDFVPDATESNLLVVSGSDGYKANLRVVTIRDSLTNNVYFDEGKFTQVKYVRTNKSKVGALIAGSDKGNLSILNYTSNDPRILDTVTVHQGEVNKIIVSPDGRFLFSAGSDGSLFIFQIGEQTLMMDSLNKNNPNS